MDDGSFNHVILDLEYFNAVPVDFQAHVGVRNILQGLGDQAIQGFRAIDRQLPAQSLVYGAHGSGAIDNKGAIVLRMMSGLVAA